MIPLNSVYNLQQTQWAFTDSDNGLLAVWHQASTWTNTELLLIETPVTKLSEILIKIW